MQTCFLLFLLCSALLSSILSGNGAHTHNILIEYIGLVCNGTLSMFIGNQHTLYKFSVFILSLVRLI